MFLLVVHSSHSGGVFRYLRGLIRTTNRTLRNNIMDTTKTKDDTAIAVQADKLNAFVRTLAEKAGVSSEDSAILADSLVEANLLGIDTHGVSRLPIYLKRISLGLIDAKAKMTFKKNMPAVGVLDAHNGLGQVAGVRAMNEAVKLAKECGIGMAGVKNSQHFGAAGYYCTIASKQGFIGMAFTNAEPALPPWGSYEAFFGTNPIAMSVPTRNDVPIVIDMSSSIVARGKIVAAARKGTPIPADWALDPDGNPTTDAQKALDGSVLTMAGPKGYALALMVDILSGVLTGGGSGKGVNSMYKDMAHPANVGHMLMAINPEAFMPREIFIERMQNLVAGIKSLKKRPGTTEINYPGERKDRVKKTRKSSGITLDESVVRELADLAKELNVEFKL